MEHIVLFKINPNLSVPVEKRILDTAARELVRIQCVDAVSWGATCTHERAEDFTHALVVRLNDSPTALEDYLGHPIHVNTRNVILNCLDPSKKNETRILAMDVKCVRDSNRPNLWKLTTLVIVAAGACGLAAKALSASTTDR